MLNFLQPAEHKSRIADEDVDKTYSRNRIKVFAGIFLGYAGYYLVRKNITDFEIFLFLTPDQLVCQHWYFVIAKFKNMKKCIF